MWGFFSDLLNMTGVVPTLIAAGTWLAHKIIGTKSDDKKAKVAHALVEAGARILQFSLESSRPMSKAEKITAAKGIVAICLAPIVNESERAKYQPMIDAAIATAVSAWMAREK
jgi:hypothetical protein